MISMISIPMLCNARIALSRPAPGLSQSPNFAQSEIVCFATTIFSSYLRSVRRVLSWSPGNPSFRHWTMKSLAQLLLVNEMMMLLKDEWMWTWPVGLHNHFLLFLDVFRHRLNI